MATEVATPSQAAKWQRGIPRCVAPKAPGATKVDRKQPKATAQCTVNRYLNKELVTKLMEQIYEVAKLEYANRLPIEMLRLDRYRLVLEPYIYHYLIERTLPTLNKFWETYLPPKKARQAFVIVERRHHPNFEFILKNIAWAAPTMSVYIFCSDVNRKFIEAILGDKASHYNISEAFVGQGSRNQGKTEYNNFFTNADSYRKIDAEYIMTVQMDNFFRRKLPLHVVFIGDYWGNPWAWNTNAPGGGGATVRRVQTMIELCDKFRPPPRADMNDNEDSWMCEHLLKIKGDYPPIAYRRQVIMESVAVEDPYIIHQFWTFMEQYMPMSKKDFTAYWSHLLSLSLSDD